MIVSPTEPSALRKLGHLGNRPEDFGIDYLWFVSHERAWAGVQRKEVDDLFASVRDGRLTKEIGQWGDLCHVMLLVEGTMELVGGNITSFRNPRNTMSLSQWDALMWRVQDQGAKVNASMSHADSSDTILRFEEWTKKERHSSLTARPTANLTSSWRKATSREMKMHLLQGFPGIGPELAGRIIDYFDGLPLSWSVTAGELSGVTGIGKKKATELVGMLNHDRGRTAHPAAGDVPGEPGGALASVTQIRPY